MSDQQVKKKRQTREARLVLVADLYKKGYSYSKIIAELRNQEFKLSKSTLHNDVQVLLKEWRASRLKDTEDMIQLELERIDDAVRELWEAWEKSKTDAVQTASKVKGSASIEDIEKEVEKERVSAVEKSEKREAQSGDPRYIAEIRQQLAERRKLLGLYAPDKKEISGNLDFGAFLMQASVTDDEQYQP